MNCKHCGMNGRHVGGYAPCPFRTKKWRWIKI